jgi:hypothetical protein
LDNVFKVGNNRILFYKTDERDYDILKTFLSYLNIARDIVYGIPGKNINVARLHSTNLTEI